MNNQDFMLLTEQYLDGTISRAGRQALQQAVTDNAEWAHLFEQQARQHVRLHAQTSRCDLTESQRIAAMVVDVVEKSHDLHPTLVELLKGPSLRERIRAVVRGLHAPKHSYAYRYARDALTRVFGPPVISIGLNVVAILLLVFLAGKEQVPPPFTITQNIDFGPDIPRETLDPKSGEIVAPGDPGPGLGPVAPLAPPSPTELPSGPPTPEPPLSSGPDLGVTPPAASELPAFRGPASPKLLPLPYRGRTRDERIVILKRTVGSEKTEHGVASALRWLKEHQEPSGAWLGQEPVAMTGLALLTFLGHGETPFDSIEYNLTVEKAIKYLLSVQDENGFFSKNVYAHGIATYAMSEACTMTRITAVQQAMEKAVAALIRGQQAGGGFDYNYAKGSRFDTSVSGWQIQALKAAKLSGMNDPKLEAAIAKSIEFLRTQSFARDGSGFVYSGKPGVQPPGGASWTMTGVGTLCLQMLGKASVPEVRTGLRVLNDVSFSWPDGKDGKAPVYGSYYVTQAKYQEGKASWTRWNQQFSKELLTHQRNDGHWEGGDYEQGSHVYTTTLCTLMLEVYYRYLPTYGSTATNAPVNTAEDDVPVHVF